MNQETVNIYETGFRSGSDTQAKNWHHFNSPKGLGNLGSERIFAKPSMEGYKDLLYVQRSFTDGISGNTGKLFKSVRPQVATGGSENQQHLYKRSDFAQPSLSGSNSKNLIASKQLGVLKNSRSFDVRDIISPANVMPNPSDSRTNLYSVIPPEQAKQDLLIQSVTKELARLGVPQSLYSGLIRAIKNTHVTSEPNEPVLSGRELELRINNLESQLVSVRREYNQVLTGWSNSVLPYQQ